NVAVQKQQRAERLTLGRRAHILICGQGRQKRVHFLRSHRRWMPLVVEEDESFDPADVRLFRPPAVVSSADCSANAIEKFRLLHSPRLPRIGAKGKNFYGG